MNIIIVLNILKKIYQLIYIMKYRLIDINTKQSKKYNSVEQIAREFNTSYCSMHRYISGKDHNNNSKISKLLENYIIEKVTNIKPTIKEKEATEKQPWICFKNAHTLAEPNSYFILRTNYKNIKKLINEIMNSNKKMYKYIKGLSYMREDINWGTLIVHYKLVVVQTNIYKTDITTSIKITQDIFDNNIKPLFINTNVNVYGTKFIYNINENQYIEILGEYNHVNNDFNKFIV